ncbi:PilW family protein [Massilia sp. 9096]|uniref:PilW family protein n=1 Tax=Massilia sp. 9096 TaxID=1500894 RepID=UPI000564B44F|nr:PilW family protein [Massilia sp. 9096]
MKTRSALRRRGFSLVELLVSIVIGLIALLFAVRLMSGSEQAQRAEVGGSDAMQNGMVALFSMSRDAGQAGFGLNDPILTGCDTVLSAGAGYTLATALRGSATVHPLAPVIIESNGQDPDRISFYAGSSMGGTGSVRTVDTYAGATSLSIDRVPFGFGKGDVIVVAPEQSGGQCALAQLSVDPNLLPTKSVQFDTGADYPFNSGQLGIAAPAGATRVFDLGPSSSLGFHTWSVDTGVLKLSATDVPGSGQTPASVADNIVSIKAQYGFDTRAGAAFTPASGMSVTQWSSSMISADGDSVVGTAGDYARIAAVRIAVVARSKAPEIAGSGGVCTATTALPVVFASASGNAAAIPVTVNVAVAGNSVDWRCYRYRVFETIVPLRNFGWRP